MRLVHDVEAIAWGVFLHLEPVLNLGIETSTLALILIDEGVGAKFIINGSTFTGAGMAGTISRLVVQPEGAFFTKLRSRGNLEVFASRPWISRSIIENHISMLTKTPQGNCESQELREFANKLKSLAADEGSWELLTFDDIAKGITIEHRGCRKAVDAAAKHIGHTVHKIMTILNPHAIVLTGDAIEKLPGFYNTINEVAMDAAWPNCWTSCKMIEGDNARSSQATGAVFLGAKYE